MATTGSTTQTAAQQAQAQAEATVAADTSSASPTPGYQPTTGSTTATNATNDRYQAPSTNAHLVIPKSTVPITVPTASTPKDSVLLKELAKFLGLPTKNDSTQTIIKRLEERVGVGKSPGVRDVKAAQKGATTTAGQAKPASSGKPQASDWVPDSFPHQNPSPHESGLQAAGGAGTSPDPMFEFPKQRGEPATPAPTPAAAPKPSTPTQKKDGLTYTWLEDPKIPGTYAWVADNNGEPVIGDFPEPKSQDTQGAEPDKPGKVSAASQPASDTLTPQEQQQVAQIAQHIGADGTSLADVAAKLNLSPGGTAVSGTVALQQIGGQTVGQAAAAFYKSISGNSAAAKAQLAAWTKDLEAVGFLDTDQGNATPDANDVANAYVHKLLVPAAQASQNPAQYYQQQVTATKLSSSGQSSSEAEAFVQGVATQFGVPMSPDQITRVSNLFTAEGDITTTQLDAVQDQIKDAVMSYYDPNSTTAPTTGVAAQIYQDIQQAALEYQIPISSQGINKMVANALQGASISTPYQAASSATGVATLQFQKQAAGLYPSLAPQIKAGNTVQSLTQPYLNVAQSITGVPASTMMTDMSTGGLSKWSAFLQAPSQGGGAASTQVNNSTAKDQGGSQMMTLDQWKTYLMQQPQYGFQNTQGGKNMASQMVSAILNTFGKVNTDGGSSQPFNALDPSQALSANS